MNIAHPDDRLLGALQAIYRAAVEPLRLHLAECDRHAEAPLVTLNATEAISRLMDAHGAEQVALWVADAALARGVVLSRVAIAKAESQP